MQVIYAVLALGLIGLTFGLLLSIAARVFAVTVDPRVDAVKEILPGVNCGACGYAGCVNFAEAVVHGEAKTNGCIPGGEDTTRAIAEELGLEVLESESLVAVLFCIGGNATAVDRFIYDGVKDCAVAGRMNYGFKACRYGCLGLGNCVDACPFEAISMGAHGLPVIDMEACTGCGVCVSSCPRNLLKTIPGSREAHLVLCSSHDRGKSVAKACKNGCIACRACVKACDQDAIEMQDNLAVIDPEKCNNCGDCIPACRPETIYTLSSLPKSEDEVKDVSVKERKVAASGE